MSLKSAGKNERDQEEARDKAAGEALLKTISEILAANPQLGVSLADYQATENRLAAKSVETRMQSRRAFLRLIATKIGGR